MTDAAFEQAVETAARAMHEIWGLGGRAGLSWEQEGGVADHWRAYARAGLTAVGWPSVAGTGVTTA